jgi:hypothetical protein
VATGGFFGASFAFFFATVAAESSWKSNVDSSGCIAEELAGGNGGGVARAGAACGLTTGTGGGDGRIADACGGFAAAWGMATGRTAATGAVIVKTSWHFGQRTFFPASESSTDSLVAHLGQLLTRAMVPPLLENLLLFMIGKGQIDVKKQCNYSRRGVFFS